MNTMWQLQETENPIKTNKTDRVAAEHADRHDLQQSQTINDYLLPIAVSARHRRVPEYAGSPAM